MKFSDSELSDIRISVQDRIGLVEAAAERQCQQQRPYTGMWDESYTIEIDRLKALIAKIIA